MRAKKALYNSITSLLLQVVTAVFGLILPGLMIRAFGSEANGAISSISQFLGYISLIEAGVGGVARAALYGPLAEKNIKKISGIINATERFFRKIAGIFVVYALVIAVIYPYITKSELEWIYTFVLVLIIALSTFTQYYFGITYSVLLNADQSAYIVNIIQIFTVILNSVLAIILIHVHCSLHIVKLVSSFIYIIRPILLKVFVTKKYQLDKTIIPDNAAVKARWNGLGHHIAYFLHNNTDIFLISIFLGLKFVSVYSIYYMIISTIKNIIIALTGGVEAAFGNMIAQKEKKTLIRNFQLIETLTGIFSVFLFSSTLILLFDFISIYTKGVQDVEYVLPVFGWTIVLSEMLHCLKNPYHSLVLAAGHYKETQKGAFLEAGINISVSLVAVLLWGLVGVVIGTIIATCYRIMDYIFYLKKHIIERPIKMFIKRQLVNIITFVCIIIVCYSVPFFVTASYFSWVLKAIIVVTISMCITLFFNLIFYKEDLVLFLNKLKVAIKR